MNIPGLETREFWMLLLMCAFGLAGSWTFYFGWKGWTNTSPTLGSTFRYAVLGVVVGMLLWVRTQGGVNLDHYTAGERAFAWGCVAEFWAAMVRTSVEQRAQQAAITRAGELMVETSPPPAGPVFVKGGYSQVTYAPKNLQKRPLTHDHRPGAGARKPKDRFKR